MKDMENDGWIHVGALDDIPALGSRVVKAPAGDIAIFRTSDNQVFALLDRCPHKNGPLSQGIVHGQRVTCPLHNWVIQLEDGHATAPDVGCTPAYPIQVIDRSIYIQLTEKPGKRPAAD